MKIIVGLGNPGDKYENTRHNVGFMAVDFVLRDNKYITSKPGKDFKSEISSWLSPADEKIIFMKPQTYMNDSGQALKVVCNFYKIDFKKDLLIIHDEVDLPFGTTRFNQGSSAAGHNGIKSIIEELGTQDFCRLRVGVETRASKTDMPTDSFVLQNFSKEEMEKLKTEIFPNVKIEVEKFLGLN